MNDYENSCKSQELFDGLHGKSIFPFKQKVVLLYEHFFFDKFMSTVSFVIYCGESDPNGKLSFCYNKVYKMFFDSLANAGRKLMDLLQSYCKK